MQNITMTSLTNELDANKIMVQLYLGIHDNKLLQVMVGIITNSSICMSSGFRELIPCCSAIPVLSVYNHLNSEDWLSNTKFQRGGF